MQLKLEDTLNEGPCPYCEDGKPHEGGVVLYVTPDGEWRCFADLKIYRCERGLKPRISILKYLIEYARMKGLQAFAALDPGCNPIQIYVAPPIPEPICRMPKVEWPQEFKDKILVYYVTIVKTHKYVTMVETYESAVEHIERFFQERYVRVSQEVVKRVLEGEGHEP
jgi:hypothetical protein